MDDALACDGLGQNTNEEAQHRGPAVETLNLPELLFMNGVSSGVLEPLVTCLLLVHGNDADV